MIYRVYNVKETFPLIGQTPDDFSGHLYPWMSPATVRNLRTLCDSKLYARHPAGKAGNVSNIDASRTTYDDAIKKIKILRCTGYPKLAGV